MLFNSAAFILLFAPIVLTMYYLFFRWRGQRLALYWLAAASFFFYGCWEWRYTMLLGLYLSINAVVLNRMRASQLPRHRDTWFWLGVVANVGALAYYKYAHFFLENLDVLLGTNWQWERIILPVGISFFTFQQITLLSDARLKEQDQPRGILDHAVFIAFFPYLISGPIVYHRETDHQFAANPLPHLWDNLETGLTLFAIGLGKKVLVADVMGRWVNPVFDAAAGGYHPHLLESWAAVTAYTFQLYFDFSGYSDMAMGCALCFGIRLPINFASPLKARSIIEFWGRWHITLSRLIMNHLHASLALWFMRHRSHNAVRRLSPWSMTVTAPLLITFLLMGVWHGAGWNFLLYGLIHGVAAVVSHAWKERRKPLTPWLAWLTTFLVLNLSWVPFRATNFAAIVNMYAGLTGLNGFAVPPWILAQVQPGLADFLHLVPGVLGHVPATQYFLLFPPLLWAVLNLPNSCEMLGAQKPGLASKGYPVTRIPVTCPSPWSRARVSWWASAVLLVSIVAVFVQQAVPYVYFQF
ncbi:MAG: MBOAT family protein [Magnetococcales bacterium]|nr:MBOAT family protein [Magnetococcales bacterium]